MGSCISKCKPKKSRKNEPPKQDDCKCKCIEPNSTNFVQDKLVISQSPAPSTPLKASLISPMSPVKSSSSDASSCTKLSKYPTTSSNSSTSSCSLLSSASSLASTMSSSSIISSKLDRSFSNDFLWSCVKENPQVIKADYLPTSKLVNYKARSSLPTRSHISAKKLNGPKQLPSLSPQRIVRPVAQKRPRCSSPSSLTRQKSFRTEPEPEPKSVSASGRIMRPISPSPSRRFSGEFMNQGRNITSSMRRENCYVRPHSPNRTSNSHSKRYGRSNNLLVKKNEEYIKGVSSKIGELAIGSLVSAQDMDLMPIEDANNPHIALDCFIFL